MKTPMDRETVRKWKDGYEEFNRLEIELRRQETFTDRWNAFAAIDSLTAFINKPIPKKNIEQPRERWIALRKALSEQES
jgi:hypothetical protein